MHQTDLWANKVTTHKIQSLRWFLRAPAKCKIREWFNSTFQNTINSRLSTVFLSNAWPFAQHLYHMLYTFSKIKSLFLGVVKLSLLGTLTGLYKHPGNWTHYFFYYLILPCKELAFLSGLFPKIKKAPKEYLNNCVSFLCLQAAKA